MTSNEDCNMRQVVFEEVIVLLCARYVHEYVGSIKML